MAEKKTNTTTHTHSILTPLTWAWFGLSSMAVFMGIMGILEIFFGHGMGVVVCIPWALSLIISLPSLMAANRALKKVESKPPQNAMIADATQPNIENLIFTSISISASVILLPSLFLLLACSLFLHCNATYIENYITVIIVSTTLLLLSTIIHRYRTKKVQDKLSYSVQLSPGQKTLQYMLVYLLYPLVISFIISFVSDQIDTLIMLGVTIIDIWLLLRLNKPTAKNIAQKKQTLTHNTGPGTVFYIMTCLIWMYAGLLGCVSSAFKTSQLEQVMVGILACFLTYLIWIWISNKAKTPSITFSNPNSTLLGMVWILTTGITIVSILILLPFALLCIRSLLHLDSMAIFSDLLIVAICVILIFACNRTYRHFEKKLKQTKD